MTDTVSARRRWLPSLTFGKETWAALWTDPAPIREELFGPERLEQHGESLAAVQKVGESALKVAPLQRRLNDNNRVLLNVYRGIASDAEAGVPIVPASEWLLDNFHLVEEQIQAIRHDLPPGYYKQLPKLSEGPFAGYPRVFGIAWAFVAHTDSHFDPELLKAFVGAYQRVQPLTIGELWAIAITLKIVLIENLRRLADQLSIGRRERAAADRLGDRVLSGESDSPEIRSNVGESITDRFAAQLAKRLRGEDPHTTPVLGWLERRLAAQGSSIEEAVRTSLQRQTASNLTVRNIITSMRAISSLDWAAFFESVSLVDAKLRGDSDFAIMDFPTRDLYRNAIEGLSRGSDLDELEVVAVVIGSLDQPATSDVAQLDADRISDPGFHLIAGGRRALERRIGFRPKFRTLALRFGRGLGIRGYVALNILFSLLLSCVTALAIRGAGASAFSFWLFWISSFFIATEVVTAVINRIVTKLYGPIVLPALELKSGIPPGLRTMVAVPTLLTSESDILEEIESLEVRFLASGGGDLLFALLVDGADSPTEVLDADHRLLSMAGAAIDRLNERHGSTRAGKRFHLFYRRRLFNPSEGKWMGWERKRGKLHEFNRLLRGATDTTFVAVNGRDLDVPEDVRYVITLDADTHIPRDAAERLIGKMAHPLNRARFDEVKQRVTEGYAVLQPRVTPALPLGNSGSLYQRIFSGSSGIDPYAAAVSDVYQDLFGEGSYTGKGIYDVDAFEAALKGRVPDNTMLSHDLFEGTFARAGLASDIEVIEDFPTRYDVDQARRHRWVRGDWQLLPWIIGLRKSQGGLPAAGRWKMIDNLRRSVVPPFALLCVGACLFMPSRASNLGIFLILMGMGIPHLLPPLMSVLPRGADNRLLGHFLALLQDAQLGSRRFLLQIAFLADEAWRMCDAILRTLYRLTISKRRLLQWTTAAQAARARRPDLVSAYGEAAPGTLLGIAFSVAAFIVVPGHSVLPVVVALIWALGPAIAFWLSCARVAEHRLEPTPEEERELRWIARRTWRYFETFVTPEDNMLPPDNFQETPKSAIAHRTSPTNIGLYLLSTVAARDFGWAGALETIERLEATFATMKKMQGFMGHLFNWYDTKDLRPLDPQYVSTVDSGNLAGHLIAVAGACEEWRSALIGGDLRAGLRDGIGILRQLSVSSVEQQELIAPLDRLEAALHAVPEEAMLLEQLRTAFGELRDLRKREPGQIGDEIAAWIVALAKTVESHIRDRGIAPTERLSWDDRLDALAKDAREMALRMDFSFLLHPDRKLLSIGYTPGNRELDQNCYDLLASESRLGSLFAIAKGDVPTVHWFRLGRAAAPVGLGSALISWSGSMFEYLMPSLVMRAPIGSLLEQTTRLVVKRQEEYGETLGIPWGVSESAYNARDAEMTYQYHVFGVPGLGLKRGLAGDVVIAPYATGLAAMVNPHAALRNYRRLAEMGALGQFGYYEAIDYTRSRVPEGDTFAIVRNYMSHHQSMTIVAIADAVHDGRMRSRFHSDPMIRATDMLLQERVPRDVPVMLPRAEEVKVGTIETATDAPAVRRHSIMEDAPPVTHLLSNGRYSVMVTARGGGYSRWDDIAITRWRESGVEDDWGQLVFLRDLSDGRRWTIGARLPEEAPETDTILLAEHHASFTRSDAGIETGYDVVVSAEDPAEARRLTVTNRGKQIREIEITTYAELVLQPAAADNAHPAFSKMFVQTEFHSEHDALMAFRRPRSSSDRPVWVAQFVVTEGDLAGPITYETDRAKFLGRGRSADRAEVLMDDRALSNTTGTVLDPIFAFRHKVRIYPGRSAQVVFWTVVAPSRHELADLIDKHHDRNAFERARTSSWTRAQVQLRHLDIESEEATLFQALSGPILYNDRSFRAPSDAVVRGAAPQASLWPMSISGDRPIVLLRLDDTDDIPVLRQLLKAHEYWLLHGLSVDLVVVNDRASSYIQDLQNAIDVAVRGRRLRPGSAPNDHRGSVIVLRADALTAEARALLQAVARVSLVARNGDLAQQLGRRPAPAKRGVRALPKAASGGATAGPTNLEFFNGLGGFAEDGKEYVVILKGGKTTPTPWVNIISNPGFGFQVSADGSGFTWSENSRENQLSSWSNDPVRDRSGEAIYVTDLESREMTSPTAWPIRDEGTYVARHGFGYSRFEHQSMGLELELTQFVAPDDPIKISRLTIKNVSGRRRRISVTAYIEWILGTSRVTPRTLILTERDETTGALFGRNPWSTAFGGRVSFADLGPDVSEWTTDRAEFLGRNGTENAPAALAAGARLHGRSGGGLDACAVQRREIELGAGKEVELSWLIGQAADADRARDLITRYRATDSDQVLASARNVWSKRLGVLQVKTPDRAMDIMLNGWLLYQAIACRVWARSGFYQASGAYGFRDQLQDGMALSFADPDEQRRHLLRVAGRQFVEGDVQHWWLPHSGQGVRTRISDDRVWLAYGVALYVERSGDKTILDEVVPYLEGPRLGENEHDSFFQPQVSEQSANVFEHCAKALDAAIDLVGQHGLPLMGTGDWNDGMNRVGEGGQGESVWLAWLMLRTIDMFAPLAEMRDLARAERWRRAVPKLTDAIEREAWDGEWYRRASYDDGTWLGTRDGDECQIDSIAQSWSVLSRHAEQARMRQAMESLDRRLIDWKDGLAVLFTPPFDQGERDPGYIKGYPPGLRENGGQYSHASMWSIFAFAELGDATKAHALFELLNPISHTRTSSDVDRYKVEPYVVAADVYSVQPHRGRGGWTWYTGSAAWMYRSGVEAILGVTREGDHFVIAPRMPQSWDGFVATLTLAGATYRIDVSRGKPGLKLDGLEVPFDGRLARVPIAPDGDHQVVIRTA